MVLSLITEASKNMHLDEAKHRVVNLTIDNIQKIVTVNN